MIMNARVENCITLALAAIVIVGCYAFGAGASSWTGLLFLLNLNTTRTGP